MYKVGTSKHSDGGKVRGWEGSTSGRYDVGTSQHSTVGKVRGRESTRSGRYEVGKVRRWEGSTVGRFDGGKVRRWEGSTSNLPNTAPSKSHDAATSRGSECQQFELRNVPEPHSSYVQKDRLWDIATSRRRGCGTLLHPEGEASGRPNTRASERSSPATSQPSDVRHPQRRGPTPPRRQSRETESVRPHTAGIPQDHTTAAVSGILSPGTRAAGRET